MKEQNMYWKEGFYDYAIEGGILITIEYWLLLLNEQSTGKVITTDENGYPIAVKYESTLEQLKTNMLNTITAYDLSDAINKFYVNGKVMWLSKSDRLAIRELAKIKIANGDSSIVVWYNSELFNIPLGGFDKFLDSIEIYASQCYDITLRHIANVKGMTSKTEVSSYDYTLGYPNKVEITTLN